MAVNLGYACINMTLQKQEKVQCNRGMIKRTFSEKGIQYASELALSNVKALHRVIEWNNENGISVYRMTSCLFPWFSEYEIEELPDIEEISLVLRSAGDLALSRGQRLSFHPGPFNCLASPNESVVTKTIKELNDHSKQMDLMGLPTSPVAKINIHVGGSYGDRESALKRFCDNFAKLSDGARARLTVENDDKQSMYSTKMLVDNVSKNIGIPVVFDSHHFLLGPQDQDYKDAFYSARETWEKKGVKQICHHSNSKRDHEDPKAKPQAHSGWYYDPFESFGEEVDVVLECKMKEKALMKYRKDFSEKEALKNAG